MIHFAEEIIFIVRYITGGVMSGIFLLCILFYLLNLNGDYRSIQSIAFLVSIFGMIDTPACWTIDQFIDPFYHAHVAIVSIF
jgi:ABC-type branched-subunit amino acid transport system permease subunit